METLHSVMRVCVRNQLLVLIISLCSFHANAQNGYSALGDSLTAGLFFGDGTITCAAQNDAVVALDNQRSCIGGGVANVGGWQPELSQLLGQNVFNYGNTDETTSEILARVDAVLNSSPAETILLMAGTNDVIIDVPLDSIISNLSATIDAIQSQGKLVVVATIPPLFGSIFDAKNPQVLALNDEIRNLNGVLVADQYSALEPEWSINTSGDFIHLGDQGNSIVAQTWFAAMNEGDKDDDVPIILTPIIDLIINGES